MGDPLCATPAGPFVCNCRHDLTAVPHFDPTISAATLIAVLAAAFGGYRAFCEIRTLLKVHTEQFAQHREDDQANFRRVEDRLDQQRDMIHAVDTKVAALKR